VCVCVFQKKTSSPEGTVAWGAKNGERLFVCGCVAKKNGEG